MGFVSLSEDIQKVRDDYDHFHRSAETTIRLLDETYEKLRAEMDYRYRLKRMGEMRDLDSAAHALYEDLGRFLQNQLQRAAAIRDDAIRYLTDGKVHIVGRLRKLERQRDELRRERDGALGSNETLRNELLDLRDEVQDLRERLGATAKALDEANNRNAFASAVTGVVPLKRR